MYRLFLKIILLIIFLNSFLFFVQNKNSIYAATVFSDNFDRPDSQSLGSNWVLFYGEQPAGIENNQAYIEVDAGGLWGFYKVANLNIQDQDVKIKFVHQNGDSTLLARVIDINNRIAINYYQTGSLQIYEVYNGNYRLIPNTAPNAIVGEIYTFRVNLIGNSIKVWVNDIQYADATLNHITSGSAGFGANDGYTKVFFEDFIVEGETTSTPLPVLSVPDLKQYSLPWKNKVYDHKNASIEKFGCALTAASMVLQYHGHNIMPDVLNNWLKNQPDGYLRNGLVNWLAVSRYTKENYSPSSRTLEYKRLEGTFENLDNELNNDRPAILKEPGHFVVATGKTADTYLINDPGYSNRTDLSSYDNNFLKINSYTPTDSDLSYMMFVTDPNINLELLNSSESVVLIDSYIEDPIVSLLNPDKKSGNPVKIYLFEKPETGKYVLKATGPKGKYNLESYLYNTNGKVTKNSFDGRLKENDVDTFNINYENKKKKSSFWYWHKFFSKFFENYSEYN